jgi:hypothetical protein
MTNTGSPAPGPDISPELIEAYRRTEYKVLIDGEPRHIMRVDEPSGFLLNVLRIHNVTQSAFLTAWNPHSQPLEQKVNAQRMEQLRNEIGEHWVCYDGLGADPEGHWPPEPSFLLLGISLSDALGLAQKYGQNAILYSDLRLDSEAIPRLVFPSASTISDWSPPPPPAD